MAADIEIFDTDVGVTIEATLNFTAFDPAGGIARLHVEDESAGLLMTLVATGPTTAKASYVVQSADFAAGSHKAQVRLTKGTVVLNSELFRINVKKSQQP